MRRLRVFPAVLLAVLMVPALSPAAPAAPVLPELVDVRARHAADEDLVVFQFEGGIPSDIRAKYVDQLVADGSGLPVRIAGRAFLQVTFQLTEWVGGIQAPARKAFALPNVMTVVRSGLFEGVTTYGIGLAKRTRFEVRKDPARNRVVVAVRAAFPTVDRLVYFFDKNRFLANEEPFFVPRVRPVRASAPAVGVMDRIFAGPLDRERAHGLRLLRSRATGFAGLSIVEGIARVRLLGGCNSGGSTVTVAGEVMPSLRQFASVDWVKIYDPAGRTADPTGPSDSIPDCLNP